jgi:hypothetical protein
VLAKPAQTPVELTIYDASDKIVRRYSSADAAPKADPAKAGYAPEWFPRLAQLGTTAGMHRFVWPLRYAKPAALANDDTDRDGVFAPPGRYTIELAVDGQSLRQPLTVAPDPRVKLDDAAYAEQFAFARDVESAQLKLAPAQGEAKTLHKALVAERAAVADQTDLANAIATLDADVIADAGLVEAGNPHNAWALPATSTTSLRFVGETLEKLATAADGADAAPSPDARKGYEAATALLDKSLADWSALKTTKLEALNKALEAANRKPISTEAARKKE